jgi:hypothetical protein
MPTRNELLAAHFIKVADITAVYADATGAIGTVDVVEIDAPSGWVQLCCTAGKQIRIAAKAAARVAMGRIRPRRWSCDRSPQMRRGLTPHRTVIQRALAAVETVDQRIADLQRTGGMRDMNDEFRWQGDIASATVPLWIGSDRSESQ